MVRDLLESALVPARVSERQIARRLRTDRRTFALTFFRRFAKPMPANAGGNVRQSQREKRPSRHAGGCGHSIGRGEGKRWWSTAFRPIRLFLDVGGDVRASLAIRYLLASNLRRNV